MFILSLFVHFITACLLMMLVNHVCLRPWRRAGGAHWTERARLLWPVRYTANLCVFIVPFLLFQLHMWLFPQPTGIAWDWIFSGLAAFLGAILGNYPLERVVFPKITFRGWLLQKIALWGSFFGIWITLGMGVFLMPANFNWKMPAVAVGFIVCYCLFQWGLLFRYLRLLKFLKPAGPRLNQIIEQRRARLGNVKVNAAWQMDGPYANAFAMPVTRELVFCDRLLAVCDDAEVAAICDHELAHLKESKAVLFVRIVGSFSLFPLIFTTPAGQHFGYWGIGVCFIAMFLIVRFVKTVSQRMEKKADQLAFSEEAHSGVYARALEKLYHANLTPATNVNNRQTHPHLYDRMLAAGITPDYPRPPRPKRLTWAGWLILFLFVAAFIAVTAFQPPSN